MKKNSIGVDRVASRASMICIAGMILASAIVPAMATTQKITSPDAKSAPAAAQQSSATDDPTVTLAGILATACRQDTAKFPDYLTASNATFYRQLAPAQQVAILRRLVLLDDAGRALLSTRTDGTTEIRCETTSTTRLIHISAPRTDQNISFVPIDLKPDRQINFGLLATKEGWKLLSLGLLVLDFAQLQPQWEAQDMALREDVATEAMHKICAAIDTYRKAFEKLPESLAQLGPAPKEGISPEAAGLLTEELASGTVEGYTLRYRIIPSGPGGADTEFELAAMPKEYGKSGKRSFFINASGRLRGGDKLGAFATAADPLIEENSADH
jgi:hypothetical protein